MKVKQAMKTSKSAAFSNNFGTGSTFFHTLGTSLELQVAFSCEWEEFVRVGASGWECWSTCELVQTGVWNKCSHNAQFQPPPTLIHRCECTCRDGHTQCLPTSIHLLILVSHRDNQACVWVFVCVCVHIKLHFSEDVGTLIKESVDRHRHAHVCI